MRLNAALTRRLVTAVEGWGHRPDLAGLRWSAPPDWHLTLAFLGDVAPDRVSRVVERLSEQARGHARMRLEAGGLGGFPSSSRARVAWYGVADPGSELRRLADDVGRAVDLEPDRPFTPHITLARAHGRAVDLRAWLEDAVAPAGILAVDRIELVRSRSNGSPNRYETLAALRLNGGGRSVRRRA
ncbi:MAG: RNA 2',3'-cyclic phosphodiesterase [Chloroflexi bacterium]|nr:RNA 2',3'-cyclic phosphodiesterase [Chloroflexota bacterium]